MAKKSDRATRQTELDLDPKAPVETGAVEEPVDEGETLAWVCHPVKRRPAVSVAVTVFLVIAAVLVYWSTSSNLLTVLALVVLLASLAKFYFPTRYKLTEKGFHVTTTTQKLFREWSMFRTYHPDRNGVLLSPFTRRTRLENFRGYYMMFEGNAPEVMDFVKRHVHIERPDSNPPAEQLTADKAADSDKGDQA